MALNIKVEPIEESSNVVIPVVNLSDTSDEDELFGSIINQNPEIKQPERSSTPETHCSICLDVLNNRCRTDSCWHYFCFECLKRWSSIESSCPLCKKGFRLISHTFTNQGSQETYAVPTQDSSPLPRLTLRPELQDVNRMNFFLDIVRSTERFQSIIAPHENQNSYVSANNASSIRVRVYSENVWARPLPDTSGRFRFCDASFFRNNPAQIYRLTGFILRDISAIRELEVSNGLYRTTSQTSLTNIIIHMLFEHDIGEPSFADLLLSYLGRYASHFCHELYVFASSPFDLIGYDRNVLFNDGPEFEEPEHIIYPRSPPPVPVLNHYNLALDTFNIGPRSPIVVPSTPIIVDSDSETESVTLQFSQEVIVLSSASSEDSDIEILSYSYRPVDGSEHQTISFRDQPSTSTGIRHSVDRPNNRYNLRRRRLISPNDSSDWLEENVSRRTNFNRAMRSIDYTSSSDDEETTTSSYNSRVSSRRKPVSRKRKKKSKKNEPPKKRNTVDDSRSSIHGNRRYPPHSSSSSSSETDTRMNSYTPIHFDVAS